MLVKPFRIFLDLGFRSLDADPPPIGGALLPFLHSLARSNSSLIEAAGLGVFMISAGVFVMLFEQPGSPLHRAIASPDLRRVLIGVAMGMTAIAIIYSPWGRQSGAHLNPAVTLTFLRLGKVAPADAMFYVAAQFAGGIAGTLLLSALLGNRFTLPPISAVATLPGRSGEFVALAGEVAIAFVMMTTVLTANASARLMRWTGLCAGILVAFYIAFEAPLSGTLWP